MKNILVKDAIKMLQKLPPDKKLGEFDVGIEQLITKDISVVTNSGLVYTGIFVSYDESFLHILQMDNTYVYMYRENIVAVHERIKESQKQNRVR